VSFVCELGLLYDGKIKFFESVLEGKIVEPRGTNGFAWDPIFQPIDADKTFGEMTREEKSEYNTLIDVLKKLQIFLENK
jgi:inosine/xanthosine triphosphate pyrophosphatase family protein